MISLTLQANVFSDFLIVSNLSNIELRKRNIFKKKVRESIKINNKVKKVNLNHGFRFQACTRAEDCKKSWSKGSSSDELDKSSIILSMEASISW